MKRKWLLISSSSKGLCWGNLKIAYNDETEYTFWTDLVQGQTIPSLETADDIAYFETNAKLVLVIEKETV